MQMLVEFAQAGLTDPTLIRLDVDTKLSEHLKLKKNKKTKRQTRKQKKTEKGEKRLEMD